MCRRQLARDAGVSIVQWLNAAAAAAVVVVAAAAASHVDVVASCCVNSGHKHTTSGCIGQ